MARLRSSRVRERSKSKRIGMVRLNLICVAVLSGVSLSPLIPALKTSLSSWTSLYKSDWETDAIMSDAMKSCVRAWIWTSFVGDGISIFWSKSRSMRVNAARSSNQNKSTAKLNLGICRWIDKGGMFNAPRREPL